MNNCDHIEYKCHHQNRFLLKLILKLSPSYFITCLIGALLSVTLLLGNIIIPKYLIDTIIKMQDNQTLVDYLHEFKLTTFINHYQELIIMVIIVVSFNFIINLCLRIYRYYQEVLVNKTVYRFIAELSSKVINIKYQYLEDPHYLDLIKRATFAIQNQGAIAYYLSLFEQLLVKIISFIGVISIIFFLHYLVIISLLIFSVLICLAQLGYNRYMKKLYKDILPLNRKYSYYIKTTFDKTTLMELKLFNATDLYTDKITSFNLDIYHHMKKAYFKSGVVLGFQKLVMVLQSVIVYLYVSLRVIGKTGSKLSIGQFTMFSSATIAFGNSFNGVFNTILDFNRCLNFLEAFCDFMVLPNQDKDSATTQLTTIESIRFENVSFKYPKSDALVLDQVSFEIKKGQKISIVGLNGAGKTTLIKLLCRLYQPTEGKIYVNDLEINQYQEASYLRQISAVFQDFKIFAYSIEENIIGSNPPNELLLPQVIKEVELDNVINQLPQGIKTTLNKQIEDGAQLSGGQLQKLAIARAIYKSASLVILDEPTSALDPMAEAQIYQNFNQLVKNATSIFISHRMSSSVFCDKILVLDHGKVVDFAPHHELMTHKDQLYYQLFLSQAKNYQIN